MVTQDGDNVISLGDAVTQKVTQDGDNVISLGNPEVTQDGDNVISLGNPDGCLGERDAAAQELLR